MEIVKMIFDIILVVMKWICILISPIVISFVLQFIYQFIFKKQRFKGKANRKPKKISFIYRIFILFPKQFWLDRFNRIPDSFGMFGVHIIAGEQGSGKTITLAYMLNQLQQQYPKSKVRTNFGYTNEVAPINDWRDIVHNDNGIFGQIEVLDEIQNWFNSMQSKDFPPEMLTEVTQQRKQRKCIFGTSQVFSRVAKPIREQTTLLYEPITVLGCLTIVRVYKPKISADDGLADDKKLRTVFFFVHDKKLRDTFDTYKKIEMLSKSGFKSEEKQIRVNTPLVIQKEK